MKFYEMLVKVNEFLSKCKLDFSKFIKMTEISLRVKESLSKGMWNSNKGKGNFSEGEWLFK